MDEIQALLGEVREAYGWFGLTPRFAFATKPDKAIGDPALWERAEQLIREAFAAADISYDLKPKDGTFYAPKIDIYIDDALGREWQMATIQVDLVDAARALRPDLHRRERPAAAADRHPSRDLRLARAVHRHPGRAFRRRLPALARAGPGGRHPDRGPPHRGGRASWPASCARAACGSRSTAPTTGCRTRSGSPRSRRCRTCSSSATARSRLGPSRRGRATRRAGSSRRRCLGRRWRSGWPRRRAGADRGRTPHARRCRDGLSRLSSRNGLCYPPASAGIRVVSSRAGRRMYGNTKGNRPSVETCASIR